MPLLITPLQSYFKKCINLIPDQRNAISVLMMAAKELKLTPEVFATPEMYEIRRGDHRSCT